MKARLLTPGDVAGIGSKTIAVLHTFGFRSAFDITQRVSHVPGIGQTKTQLLLMWRSRCENYFTGRLPARLPLPDETALRARFQSERQVLSATETGHSATVARTLTEIEHDSATESRK